MRSADRPPRSRPRRRLVPPPTSASSRSGCRSGPGHLRGGRGRADRARPSCPARRGCGRVSAGEPAPQAFPEANLRFREGRTPLDETASHEDWAAALARAGQPTLVAIPGADSWAASAAPPHRHADCARSPRRTATDPADADPQAVKAKSPKSPKSRSGSEGGRSGRPRRRQAKEAKAGRTEGDAGADRCGRGPDARAPPTTSARSTSSGPCASSGPPRR